MTFFGRQNPRLAKFLLLRFQYRILETNLNSITCSLFSFLILLYGSLSPPVVCAEKAQLVKEFNPFFGEIGESRPQGFTTIGNTTYFRAIDLQHGSELWKTDGTTEGTVLFKDIDPGPSYGFPSGPTEMNGMFYFIAQDVLHGRELWKSDGTPEGTVMVKDINPGSAHSGFPRAVFNLNGTLFFDADDGVNGCALWKSDGTEAGTVMVKDFHPSTEFIPCPGNFNNLNGLLVFSADDGVHGFELWRSDGTEAGTTLIKDINPGPQLGGGGSFAKLNGILYFTALNADSGFELWRTDGTETGTYLFKDIDPGPKSGNPSWTIATNGYLFFAAGDSTDGDGAELWKSDGTESGTVMVKDINPGPAGSFPTKFTDVNGTIFFSAWDPLHGTELWKSDGTESGTVLVKDIYPGFFDGNPNGSTPNHLTNLDGTLFFVAEDGLHGEELWKSDGTEAGTVLVKDIVPGFFESFPNHLTAVNGVLFFQAFDFFHGHEFWKSDGTEEGTVLVKDIFFALPQSSEVDELKDINGTLYFEANDGIHGKEPWLSKGTEISTQILKDIIPGSDASFPREFTFFNDQAVVMTNSGLWTTDGSEAGTSLIKSIGARNLTAVNNTLFFRAGDSIHGVELWKSDGTEAGTILVKDIRPGNTCPTCPKSSFPDQLIDVNGTLFFEAADDIHGRELWKSDGTEEGTTLLKDIQPGPNHGIPNPPSGIGPITTFENVNGILFFKGQDDVYGAELWKSDGTEEGTILVKDIWPGDIQPGVPKSGGAEQITNVNGTAFFIAGEPIHGGELWKSDGTEAGTVIVKDIFPGTGSSNPNFLTNVNGTLFFVATDLTFGAALWKSDGTSDGTVRVANIRQGTDTIRWFLGPFVNGNGILYFTANDGIHGWELWKSDGTEQGTTMVDDINPFAADSFPKDLTVSGDYLFFLATRWDVGEELFSLYIPDSDGDGIADEIDLDDDNDGVDDINDAFPLDPTETKDSDGDGVGDNADAFPDDPAETADFDRDGIGDNADLDDDNDGVLDVNDVFPLDPAESADADGDSIGDNADPFPQAPAVFQLQGIMIGTLICDKELSTSTKEKFKDEATFNIDLSGFPMVYTQIQMTDPPDLFTLSGMALLKNPKSGVLQLFGDDDNFKELAVSGNFKMSAANQVWVNLKGKFQFQDNGDPACTLAGKFKVK